MLSLTDAIYLGKIKGEIPDKRGKGREVEVERWEESLWRALLLSFTHKTQIDKLLVPRTVYLSVRIEKGRHTAFDSLHMPFGSWMRLSCDNIS